MSKYSDWISKSDLRSGVGGFITTDQLAHQKGSNYVVSSARSRSDIRCSNGENIASNSAAVLGAAFDVV